MQICVSRGFCSPITPYSPLPHPQLVMNLLCTILVHHKSTAVSGIKGPIMTGVLDLIQSPLLQGTAPGLLLAVLYSA